MPGCYQGVDDRPDANATTTWHVALRPGQRKALDKEKENDALIDKVEKLKAAIRIKVKHPFKTLLRLFQTLKWQ